MCLCLGVFVLCVCLLFGVCVWLLMRGVLCSRRYVCSVCCVFVCVTVCDNALGWLRMSILNNVCVHDCVRLCVVCM